MIVRGRRSESTLKGQQHRRLQNIITQLRRDNRQLRLQILKIEQKLVEAQTSKKKYKVKYRQAKQKVEILGLVGKVSPRYNDPYQLTGSPKTKSTRIKTYSQQELLSLRLPPSCSDFYDPPHHFTHHQDPYRTQPLSKSPTPLSTMPEIEQPDQEQTRILQSLLKLHEQLQKLSQQIQNRPNLQSRVSVCENQLYSKMQEVVEKLNKMEFRDLERENRRIEHQRQKQKEKKRYTSSSKAIEQIGVDLLKFKVDE